MTRHLTLIALLLGLSLSAFAQAQQSKLPPCPAVDYSKNKHTGIDGRTGAWHNCYGRYVSELNDARKGEIYDGEFQSKGDIYEGEFQNGTYNGIGTFIGSRGRRKYIGEWKDGKKHGQGIQSGVIGLEGTWVNGNFFRAEKVNLPAVNQKTDVAINEERRKLDFDRQAQSKLPPCPAVDYSIKNDIQRVSKWNNCWGRHIWEFQENGNVFEGEFQNGLPNGKGTYYYLANNQHKGNKHVGEYRDGNKHGQGTFIFANGNKYVGEYKDDKYNGKGTFTFANGNKYVGQWVDGKYNGLGTFTLANGGGFIGEWKDGKPSGRGIETYANGSPAKEGVFEDGKFVRAEKVNLPPIQQQTDVAINEERRRLDADRLALEVERQRLTEERNRREQAKQSSKLTLQTTVTNPDANGVVIISVRTNADTSSLKVNGNEEGGKSDGNYIIKRIARVGQDTEYTIIATDVFGNTASTTITVERQAVSQLNNQTAFLKPESIKRAASRDAVAIIIGIQNYKRVPKAEFANNDAKEFYEYAIRGLGIKPENIKLLLDEEADELEIVKAFENWLPLQVTKNKTDVYVFYSGHGLPSPDGQSLYFLPHGVDKQYLARTAVGQKEVVALLTASKPKSVTMFIDACYSGQTRGGETLLASAKPISLKTDTNLFPSNFTVISASANDQISSSSPELKHGIFSFYLMKGMEGDADGNKDGKITAGEMQDYLSDKVSRQAMSMSRKQDTQLVGDANRVLMGR